MPATNQAIIRRLFEEGINGGNLAVIAGCYAPDCVDRNAFRGQEGGAEAMQRALAELRTLVSGLHVTIDELRTEGETVVTRETWRATSILTGKPVMATVNHRFRLHDGLIAEEWSGGWEWLEQLLR